MCEVLEMVPSLCVQAEENPDSALLVRIPEKTSQCLNLREEGWLAEGDRVQDGRSKKGSVNQASRVPAHLHHVLNLTDTYNTSTSYKIISRCIFNNQPESHI